MRSRRFSVLAVLLAALVVVVTGCGTGDDAVAQGNTFQFVSPGGKTVITYDPPASRKKIADVSGPDVVTDANVGLDQYAGKVVVINVWGSWCGPCRGEADDLEQVYEQTKASGVQFVGINLRDDRDSAKDFIADRKVSFPSIYDFDGLTLSALTTPTAVVPTTVVLDREHRPAAVFLKAITADELRATVEKVAAEPTAQRS
ncbi:TlpA family protein disulfide reductase [Gordonia soli]|uniref:Cytochrome c biogenesis protein ResA n=1 Tax=Gordonia soli NBRC 108243 TaxID=1223545 RepID=M0QI66_9ACTN|nr:TlpA disulfide reductase family protein [Gordonia soli]GAC67986.1 cytochrome c biogenesis protein ResA [Gordonia soli NBRC 108243]